MQNRHYGDLRHGRRPIRVLPSAAHLDMAVTLLFSLMRFTPMEAMLLRAGARQMGMAVRETMGWAARR